MRKTIFLLLAVVSIFIASCGNNGNETSTDTTQDKPIDESNRITDYTAIVNDFAIVPKNNINTNSNNVELKDKKDE